MLTALIDIQSIDHFFSPQRSKTAFILFVKNYMVKDQTDSTKTINLYNVLQNRKRAFNSLPNDTILALTKFKAFADDKTTVTQKLKFVLG